MRIIDSHLHLWSLATPGHEWPCPDTPLLYRDFTIADMHAASAGVPLRGVVLVQSQPTDADTDWMLALSAREPIVSGVVGWVDLAAPDAPDRIATLATHPKMRGLRPMLQAIGDTDWLLGTDLTPALQAMVDHGLTFDALVQPRHLGMLATFMGRWPDLAVVVDHGGKPDIASGTFGAWRDDIAELAAVGAWCKLSGLRTGQPAGQPADALARWVDPLVESFGVRLMWGSDWPVLISDGETYAQWLADATRLAGPGGDAGYQLFAGAAERFYGLDRQTGDTV